MSGIKTMETTMTKNQEKFNQVYADAVIPYEDTPENRAAQQTAMDVRSLQWYGERMPLAEAAELYAGIESYNEFSGEMIPELANNFENSGIMVTPARESSVAIYLHFDPKDKVLQLEVENYILRHFRADEVDCQTFGEIRVWWD